MRFRRLHNVCVTLHLAPFFNDIFARSTAMVHLWHAVSYVSPYTYRYIHVPVHVRVQGYTNLKPNYLDTKSNRLNILSSFSSICSILKILCTTVLILHLQKENV